MLAVVVGRAVAAIEGERVPLFEHYEEVSAVYSVPAEHRENVVLMKMDVTGDGSPELFLSCTSKWSKSPSGLIFEVYTPLDSSETTYRWLRGSSVVVHVDGPFKFYFDEESRTLLSVASAEGPLIFSFDVEGGRVDVSRVAGGGLAREEPGKRTDEIGTSPVDRGTQLGARAGGSEGGVAILEIPLNQLRTALGEGSEIHEVPAFLSGAREAQQFDVAGLRGKVVIDEEGRFQARGDEE